MIGLAGNAESRLLSLRRPRPARAASVPFQHLGGRPAV